MPSDRGSSGPPSKVQATLGGMVAKRFVIERLAGRGGMASVFRALDTQTGRNVALKLMATPSGDSPEFERFTRESRLLSEFSHPGIVGHVAHGFTEQGEPFLVMEWLDGMDLSELLRRGPLRLSDTLLLIRRIAEALEVAHQHHVIHRDLKPSSVGRVGAGGGRVRGGCEVGASARELVRNGWRVDRRCVRVAQGGKGAQSWCREAEAAG